MDNVGIYTIVCNSSKKIYVGSSNNIHSRILKHKSELRLGKHRNPHLQYSYNKYGADDFTYSLLESCEENLLLYIESFWINMLDSYNSCKGFNINNPLHGGEPTFKKIDVYDLSGKFIGTYPSIKRTSLEFKTNHKSIRDVCSGKFKQTNGFVFRHHGVSFNEYDHIYKNKPLPICNIIIDQMSIDGKYMRTYESVNEASRSLGCSSSSIIRSIRKQYPTGGYLWDYHNPLRLTDHSLILIQPRRINALCKKVDQYCVDGLYIKTWLSISDIAETYSCCKSLIRKACSGINGTAKGYKWKYNNN